MPIHKFDRPDQNYVYAMLCRDGDGPGYVKFGRSYRIGQRLTALRTSCPIPAKYFAIMEVPSYPKAKAVEAALHRHFGDRKIKGEWFRFDFESLEDKRAFNDGCRLVFALHLKSPGSWTKISVAEFDEYERRRRAAFLQSKNARKIMNQSARMAKTRSA